jgi:hypothetical protein
MNQYQIKKEIEQCYRSLGNTHASLAIAIEQGNNDYETHCFNLIDEFTTRIVELQKLIK